MIKIRVAFIAIGLGAAACSPPTTETVQEGAASAVPEDVAAVVLAAVPGIRITSAEAGDDEYEVTGTLPNGDEIEVDLAEWNGAWAVLEIQRDVSWASVPEPVRAEAAAAPDAFEPVRVIESTQAAEGALVYELFRATSDGRPSGGPAMEVRWHEGRAEVLP